MIFWICILISKENKLQFIPTEKESGARPALCPSARARETVSADAPVILLAEFHRLFAGMMQSPGFG